VWRFGADGATHITTSADLTVGSVQLPAGRYTLWMLPSERGESMLIINKQVNIFGTAYNPANDLVRIPMQRAPSRPIAERFTIEIDGGRLVARWDASSWSVPLSQK
jgi:hypothetical protein